MPRRIQPSDDPAERRRNLIVATERYRSALDQNALDRHAGRVPTYGAGALTVLERRVAEAQRLVDAISEPLVRDEQTA